MKKILMICLLVSSIAVLGIAAVLFSTQGPGQNASSGVVGQDPETGQQMYLTPEVILPDQVQVQVLKTLEMDKLSTVYDMVYQEGVQDQLDKWKKKNTYTLETPLLVLNPFGTNTTGLYIYFEYGERVNVSYEVSVKEEDVCNFSAAMFTNTAGMPLKNQEGQIIGLQQGKLNYIILYLYDKDGNQVEKVGYRVDVPDYGRVKEAKLNYEMTRNETQLTPGLYCLFGYDRRNEEELRHLLFYDNEGNIRAEIPLGKGGIFDVRVQKVNGNMFFACGARQYAQINHLGKVEALYSIGKKYKSHHDFDVAAALDKCVILADERSKGTKEDVVLCLDLYTGKVKKILDFEELMPDIRAKAKITENSADQDYLDWIHFNTVQMINETDLILSSRETSTIIRVNNVFKEPKLAWFISDEIAWKGTDYEKLMLKKEGDFPSQAGQHTTTWVEDPELPEGQYYLYLYNNNYAVNHAYPDLDLTGIPGVGSYGKAAEYSYYYKYLVDENEGTYSLVQKIELPYSSIVSSAQEYGGNIITCSGMAGLFEEYTNDGRQIARFFMDVELFTYRVFKYDMKGIWFAD